MPIFLDSSFQSYIQALENSLADAGRAYFLLRPLEHHGIDLFADLHKLLKEKPVAIKKIARIRSTDLILLEK